MSLEIQEEGENFQFLETLQDIIIWFEVLLKSQIIKVSISKYWKRERESFQNQMESKTIAGIKSGRE